MKKNQGITLIELIIVLIIIGILTAIAYPSYTQHVTRARRTDGQTALMDLAARMERYYAIHHTYENYVLPSTQSPEDWYDLRITELSTINYSLEAIPKKSQAIADKECGSLTLNHLGVKGRTGNATIKSCW